MNAAQLFAERQRLWRAADRILTRCVERGRDLTPFELMTYQRLEEAIESLAAQERALLPRCGSCGQIKAN